ncbi:hypothetical protein [Ureibacillus sp. GCM10028918]|uniref:hypothetical protein n=1 Tax=Ureibacillus sp. GCM10028918 TaxID=3273429 RepID=UPI003622CC17
MTVAVHSQKVQIELKSYILFVGLGLGAGIITRLSDFFPNDDLWSFSSIATLFGFWMLTVTLIIYFSSSNKNAAINVLLYLMAMNFSFYYLNYILAFLFQDSTMKDFNGSFFYYIVFLP